MRDDLDRKIIAALRSNARQSTAQIASHIGVARTTVHERISRMERAGVIKGYSVVLGTAEELPMVQVIVLVSIVQSETPKVIKRLEGYPEVKRCLSVNGEFDLLLTVEAPRIEDLDILVDELCTVPGITRTKTHVVFGCKIDRD